ncbi:MAG: hypothetical protein R2821_08795 [Flavobacteriaceae bacterium]
MDAKILYGEDGIAQGVDLNKVDDIEEHIDNIESQERVIRNMETLKQLLEMKVLMEKFLTFRHWQRPFQVLFR